MKLIIVESPSKAKTIEKYLGGEYRVIASGGHVCDLPERSLGIDVEHGFEPEYIVSPDKKDVIKKMLAEIKKAERVYLATDPDREGEAISWHLSNVLKLNGGDIRIEFNEISKNAVLEAIGKPREINENLVDAQQARRVLDRLVGYKISPVLGRKIKSHLSGGRVQSVALRLIVDREREIRAFKPEEYWDIKANLARGKTKFKATLSDINNKKVKIKNGDESSAIIADLKNATYSVGSVKAGVSKSHPGAPFTTSTLQQDASTKLNLTAPVTMRLAQQLYEGVDIQGEGHVALVTYIRTDSVRVSQDAQNKARSYIAERYGKEYVPSKPNFYSSKQSAQDAHEAIRPITCERTPESLKKKISNDLYRLYKLIYERFLASQMADAVYNTLNVRISAKRDSKDYGFKLSGKAVKFDGYTAVYSSATSDGEENSANLPNFSEGEDISLVELLPEQKFTKPPVRFTDASLVKAMEENGIGRPSTYASIIAVIQKREYVTKVDKKYMAPTELGEVVCDTMIKYFDDIMDLRFTANMETKLDEIEDGGKEWKKLIAEFYPGFNRKVLAALNDGQKVKMQPNVSDVKCDKCGAYMVIREGRYGKFLACPNYPDCKNIRSLNEPAGKCPKCGRDVYKRKSKAGKIFYGCSGYPECSFISWELPAPVLCPKCGNVMHVVKDKEGKEKYVCANKNCKQVVLPGVKGE